MKAFFLLALLFVGSLASAQEDTRKGALYLGGGIFQDQNNLGKDTQVYQIDLMASRGYAYADTGLFYGGNGMFAFTLSSGLKIGPLYVGGLLGLNEQFVTTATSPAVTQTIQINGLAGGNAGLDFDLGPIHLRLDGIYTSHLTTETFSVGISL